jgi:hypothetical protein
VGGGGGAVVGAAVVGGGVVGASGTAAVVGAMVVGAAVVAGAFVEPAVDAFSTGFLGVMATSPTNSKNSAPHDSRPTITLLTPFLGDPGGG